MTDNKKGTSKAKSGSRPAPKASFTKQWHGQPTPQVVDPIRQISSSKFVKVLTKEGLVLANERYRETHRLLDPDAHKEYGQYGLSQRYFHDGEWHWYAPGDEPRSRGTVLKPDPPPLSLAEKGWLARRRAWAEELHERTHIFVTPVIEEPCAPWEDEPRKVWPRDVSKKYENRELKRAERRRQQQDNDRFFEHMPPGPDPTNFWAGFVPQGAGPSVPAGAKGMTPEEFVEFRREQHRALDEKWRTELNTFVAHAVGLEARGEELRPRFSSLTFYKGNPYFRQLYPQTPFLMWPEQWPGYGLHLYETGDKSQAGWDEVYDASEHLNLFNIHALAINVPTLFPDVTKYVKAVSPYYRREDRLETVDDVQAWIRAATIGREALAALPEEMVEQMGHARAVRRAADRGKDMPVKSQEQILTLTRFSRPEWLRAYRTPALRDSYVLRFPPGKHKFMRKSFASEGTYRRMCLAEAASSRDTITLQGPAPSKVLPIEDVLDVFEEELEEFGAASPPVEPEAIPLPPPREKTLEDYVGMASVFPVSEWKTAPQETAEKLGKLVLEAFKAFAGTESCVFDLRDCISIIALLCARTWKEARFHIASLFAGVGLKAIDRSADQVYALCARFFSFFTPQMDSAGESTARLANKGVKAILHSPAAKMITAFVTTLGGLLCLGKNPAIESFLEKSAKYLSGASLCATAAEQIIGMVDFWEVCYKEFMLTGDYWVLFGMSAEDLHLRKLIRLREEMEELRRKPGPLVPEALRKATRLYLESNRYKSPMILDAARALQEATVRVSDNYHLVRVAPVGFLATGPPGCGKTSMCDMVHACLRTKYGLSSDVCIQHTWQSGKHQKLAEIAALVSLNDVATNKAEYETGELGLVDLVQSLIDTAPFYTEAASLSAKDHGHLSPDIVFLTSNALKYEMSTSTCGADKLDRRLLVIECDWTDYAKSHRGPTAEVFRLASPAERAKFVSYKVGRMNNSPKDGSKASGTTIDFAVADTLMETRDVNQVVAFVMRAEAARKPNVAGKIEVCRNCFCPRPACTCVFEDFAHLARDSPEYPYVQQGAGISVPVVVDMNNYEALAQQLASAAMMLGAVVAATSVINSILEIVKVAKGPGFVDQGNVGFVANLPEDMRTPDFVAPYASTAAAWLGADRTISLAVLTWNGDGGNLHAIPITHHILATPEHFFKRAVTGDVFTVTYGGVTNAIRYDPSIVSLQGKDTAFVYVGNIQQVVNVAYQFLPEHASRPSEKVTMIGREARMVPGDYLQYATVGTVVGDCGKPLIGASGSIYGMHVGVFEMRGTGVSVPLSRKQADSAIAAFTRAGLFSERFSNEVPEILSQQMAGCPPGPSPRSDLWYGLEKEPELARGDHIPICHLGYRDSPKFSVRESTVFDVFKELLGDSRYCAPYGGKAKIVGDPPSWVGPYINRYRGTCTKPELDQARMVLAVEALVAAVPGVDTPLSPISDATAIEGSPASVLVNARDNTKSMGPLLRLNGVTKKNAFVQRGETWEVHEAVVASIRAMHAELVGSGPLGPTVCQSAVKDEVYPAEKTAMGKGRLFYVQDWTMNHMIRRYALPVMQHLMMHPFQTGVVVVLNASSPAWGELAEYLKGDGSRKIFAGDQTAYDLKHSVMIAHYVSFMVKTAAKLGYSSEDQRVLGRVLFKASRFLLLIEGNWVLSSRTLGSGRSDTIVFNCVVIGLMTYYASLGKYPGTDPREVVRFTATGDDSNQSVDPRYSELDGPAFIQAFREGGYVLTSSDKVSELHAQKIEEIDYLKRGFVNTNTRLGRFWFAPLSLKSIARSMCYSVGIAKNEARSRDVSAAESAVREMFLHGPVAYAQFCALVKRAFDDEVETPPWDQLLGEYQQGTLASWCPKTPPPLGLAGDPPEGYTQQADVAEHSAPEASREKHHVSGGADKDFPVSEPTPAFGVHSGGRTTHATETNLNAVSELIVDETNHPVQEIRVMETESLSIKPPSRSLRAEPDQLDLKQFFARPRKVAELGTAGAGSFQVFGTWRALPGVDKVLSQYGLFRGNPTITMVWTGSSQYMGLVRVGAFPTIPGAPIGPYEGSAAQNTFSFSAAAGYVTDSQLPHVDIDVSEPKTYVLTLPFPLSREYMEITDNDWTLRQSTVNAIQLASGLTPPSSVVSYYVHYDDFVMDRLVEQMATPKEAPPGYMERAFAYANRVAAILPVEYKAPVQVMASMGESVARYFGLSKPPVEPQSATVIRHFGNPSLASGQPNFGYSLGLDPDAQRTMADGVIPLAQPGESTFKSVVERPAHMVRNWAESTPLEVVPGVYQFDTAPFRMFLSPMGYVAGAFDYWTGAIKLCVEVKSSPLVRWRLGVNIVPPGATTPTSYVDDGSLPGFVIESVGSTCTEFEVPYLYAEPWREVEFLNFLAGVNTAETRVVYFSLMNSVGPSSTPVYPAVNVYYSAGEDFSCGVPNLRAFEEYTPQMATGAQAVETFGEVVDDLTLLTRRQVMSRVWTSDAAGLNEFRMPVLGLDPGAPNYNNHPDDTFAVIEMSAWTWKYWLSLMYLGNTGGHTFKLHHVRQPQTTGLITATTEVSVPSWGDSVTNVGTWWESNNVTARGATVLDEANTFMELTVPDRNTHRWRYARGTFSDGTTPAEVLRVHAFRGFPADERFNLWEGAADDYRVGGFLCAPILLQRSNTQP